MKITQINSEKIRITDDNKARTSLSILIAILGCVILTKVWSQPRVEGEALEAIIVGTILSTATSLLGLYGLLSQERITCDIDKSRESITLRRKTLTKEALSIFQINQVTGLIIEEVEGINHYAYKAKLAINRDTYIPLTGALTKDPAILEKPINIIASFIKTEVIMLKKNRPPRPNPPLF